MDNEKQDKKRLTNEQKFFAYGKILLDHYAEEEQKRELTPAEKKKVNDVKQELWNKIFLYAKSLCYKRMSKYNLPTDAYSDVLQACATQFFRYLPSYDPYRHTPSTYFMYRFQEVISEYVRKDSQHLTQNDANNLGKVRKAIQFYEGKGIEWDVNMIAAKSGLSEKVVKQTIAIGKNSIHADIDSCHDLKSNIPTPEESYLQDEKSREIADAIRDLLSDGEYHFFMCRMNLDGDKELTYKDMERLFPGVDVKSQWSKIIGKLHNSKILNSYSHAKPSHKPRLQLHSSADTIEQDMISAINSGLDLSKHDKQPDESHGKQGKP